MCLFVTKQNNELLMKNYKTRSTSSNPFLKMNVVKYANFENKSGRDRGRGCGRSHNHRQGRSRECSCGKNINND